MPQERPATAYVYPVVSKVAGLSADNTRKTKHTDRNKILTHDSQATVGTITKWKVYLQTRRSDWWVLVGG